MPERPLLGAGALLLGILCVSNMDIVAKRLSADASVIQITWARFTFHTLLLTPLVLWSLRRRPLHSALPQWKTLRWHILRGVLLTGASLSFFLAIRDNPIPDSLAVFFVEPLIVILIARRFLSEHPDRRLWIAAIVGLIGVLIILRPGGGNHYSWTIGFSFVAAFFFAGYIVLARFASFSTTVAVISWTTALFGLIPILPLLPLDWRTPETTDTWLLMIAIGVLSGLGHTFIIIACRYLAAARVAILHYAEVGVAAILNWFVFRHFPDFWVWVGFIVIALTNLYALRLDHRPHHG